VWHDSFICVTWLIHACDMTYPEPCKILLDSSMCDMTHSECDITHSVCNMIHSYVQHGSFIHLTWLTQSHARSCSTYVKDICLRGWKQGLYDAIFGGSDIYTDIYTPSKTVTYVRTCVCTMIYWGWKGGYRKYDRLLTLKNRWSIMSWIMFFEGWKQGHRNMIDHVI